MGVEPFLIASSVVMTAAQRLCRKICTYCKEEYKVPQSVLDKVGLALEKLPDPPKAFFHGKGCSKCNRSGYYGRIAVLETFVIDNAIRQMIMKKQSADQIKRYAVAHGMKTLRDNALANFLKGVTTLEEVLRVTSEE